MPRGQASRKTQVRKALDLASEFLGTKLEQPLETAEDKLREAQAALNYFQVRGQGFKHVECGECTGLFAYSYYTDGIKYCSSRCAQLALQKIGLDWDPSRPLELRWGKFVPAVVSVPALKAIQESLDAQEAQQHDMPGELAM